MSLVKLGWKEAFTAPTEKFAVGRVILEHKGMYRISDGEQEYIGELVGKFHYNATCRSDYPAVGDWVWMELLPNEGKAMIQGVFPRFSTFSRKVAGLRTDEQIVATNVDTIFLVSSLNNDFNLRRLERYLLVAYESGANPVFVLTKRDLCTDVEEKIQAIESIAYGVPIFAVDSISYNGIEALQPFVSEGKTIALLGSSGVGKSTLLNALMGETIAKTGGIREGDDRGRHTTTHRELFFVPSGGMVIDTPGMRELQLWDGADSLDTTFTDVEEFATNCRFQDCQHKSEPGCAVQEAIKNGQLSPERFSSYIKLQRELAYAMRKQDAALARQEKDKWKKIGKMQKQHYKKR
ncbi:MAG: ribosome small subunit-dependent GTPase A [Bacillaceae bacterium]